MTHKISQTTRDRLSKSMEGNNNAAGNTHRKAPPKKWRIDHRKILNKLNKRCGKEGYKSNVVRSASYFMFMEASKADQIRFMKRVRKVVR